MAYRFNPFLGNFDNTGVEFAGYTSVTAYSDLPAASLHSGEIYIVLTSTGIWPWNDKKGMYYSNGATWSWLSDSPFEFYDGSFKIRNSLSDTKSFQLVASSITAGQNRLVTVPDRNLTLDNITTATTTNGTGYLKGDGSNISFDTAVVTDAGTFGTGQILVANGTGHQATGSASLTYLAPALINNSTTPTFNAKTTGTSSYGGIIFAEGNTNVGFIQYIGSTFATTAYRNNLRINNVQNAPIEFFTNNLSRLKLQGDGSFELYSTLPFRIGGTGTGTDYVGQYGNDGTTCFFQPRVDGTAAFQFRNSTGTPGLTYDATNQRIGIGVTNPGNPLTVNGNGTANSIYTYDVSTSGQPGLVIGNTASTATATNWFANKIYGSAVATTAFGQTLANWVFLGASGTANNGILLGTITDKPIIFGTNNVERMRLTSTGLGIGTTDPTNILSLGGNSARSIWMERHTTANTTGNNLTIQAGGATVGATDKNSGVLILGGQLATGGGQTEVRILGSNGTDNGSTSDITAQVMVDVINNKLGFYGVTPVVRPIALTTQLTTITFSDPVTPDYIIADLTQTSPYGFASSDEGQTVLKVIANIQTRLSELETKLQGLGLLN